jgi:hypothetical protein
MFHVEHSTTLILLGSPNAAVADGSHNGRATQSLKTSASSGAEAGAHLNGLRGSGACADGRCAVHSQPLRRGSRQRARGRRRGGSGGRRRPVKARLPRRQRLRSGRPALRCGRGGRSGAELRARRMSSQHRWTGRERARPRAAHRVCEPLLQLRCGDHWRRERCGCRRRWSCGGGRCCACSIWLNLSGSSLRRSGLCCRRRSCGRH